jgi:predicted phosphatase
MQDVKRLMLPVFKEVISILRYYQYSKYTVASQQWNLQRLAISEKNVLRQGSAFFAFAHIVPCARKLAYLER